VWWERFHQGTQGAVFSIGPVERVLIASRALWFYAGKLVWPTDLTFSYPRWTISASEASAYVWLLATAALGVVIWRGRRRLGRGVEVAAVFFVATLSPVLGFVMLYTFLYTFVADHYQYLACLGPLALAAAGMEGGFGWAARRTPLLKPVCCAALLAILGGLAWFQCRQYAGAETLWRATLAKNSGSWMAHNELGLIRLGQGKLDEADDEFKIALALHPDDEKSYNNLGTVLSRRGEVAQAIAYFRKSLDLQPADAKAHDNLGVALFQQGQVVEAIAHFRKALDLEPDLANAHDNLGIALLQQGEAGEAVAQFRKALDLRPDLAKARENLGVALLRKGDVDGAMACFEKTTVLPADPAQRWLALGKQFLKEGRWIEAIACYRQALSINPRFAEAWAGLGMACFNNGQIKEAGEFWQKALTEAQAQKDDKLAGALQEQLKLYEARLQTHQTQ
ncbi:MAG: tetratricopeptide repeat protein, partial [Verrucomicrobiota bacterium]